MRLLGCQYLKDYYRILKYDPSASELSELLNLLTTTETYFFRNTPQLRSFREEILPAILQRKEDAGEQHLYLWSAGCSSGEEPYTLALILLDTISDLSRWKISIIGTDINTQMLVKAREDLYTARSLRETSSQYISKYFQAEGDHYRIVERVKRMVNFRFGNLINRQDASLIQNVDCIFCRSVLIYFNIESRKTALNIFYDALARHGYLLLGHSESLYRITAIFKLIKLRYYLVYYKD